MTKLEYLRLILATVGYADNDMILSARDARTLIAELDAPQPGPSAQGLVGWKLVPREPTEAMINAVGIVPEHQCRVIWRAMHDGFASPIPPDTGPDYYPSHEALHDIVQLLAEKDALNGGGPGWSGRWEKAVLRAEELVRVEP